MEQPSNNNMVPSPGASVWSAQVLGPYPEMYAAAASAPDASSSRTTSLHIPRFLKILNSVINAFPTIAIDATNDTLYSALHSYPFVKEKLGQGLLLLAASVSEAIDGSRHPRVKTLSTFCRNVMALELIRNTVMDKFKVRGMSIEDTWQHGFEGCTYKANGRQMKPEYHPDLLDECGVKYGTLSPVNVALSTLYAIQELHQSGDEIELPVDKFGLAFVSATGSRIKSVYRFGHKIIRSVDDTGEPVYTVDNPDGKLVWAQIFECYRVDSETGRRLPETHLLRLTTWNDASFGNHGDNTKIVYADALFKVSDDAGPLGLANQALARESAENSKSKLLAMMKFKTFNPATHTIVMPIHPNQDLSIEQLDNVRFKTRNMAFCGKDELHVHPEYDIIVTGMRNCMESRESRGYAFVGYPGTGKTILIRQLMMEFPDVPVIQFSIAMLTASDWSRSFAILDGVVKSLVDAGYGKLIFACDDIDSIKDGFEKQAIAPLIQLMDFLRGIRNGSDQVSTIFLATINDPTSLNDAIIKRPGRFDEVIEVPPPSREALPAIVNRLRRKDDRTDYSGPQFEQCMSMMVSNQFTMADVATTMSNIVLYGVPGSDGSYAPETLEAAITRLLTSKETAGKKF